MASPVLLCTDGSTEALDALAAGLDLLGRDHPLVLVNVMDAPDDGALVGSGHAGAELSPEEFDRLTAQASEDALSVVETSKKELGIPTAEVRILRGEAGGAICQLASELSARAIVVGSRGRGGLKRAFLGSVSDQVARNAPCSVVITRT
jgi:nucleotide-binding universal stress UspA family protein